MRHDVRHPDSGRYVSKGSMFWRHLGAIHPTIKGLMTTDDLGGPGRSPVSIHQVGQQKPRKLKGLKT